MANPLECILQAVDAITCENRIKKVQAAIKTLQPQQQELIRKKFYDNRTNVDIAAEEGVTEAAIRNRLKKIYSNLSKNFKIGVRTPLFFRLYMKGTIKTFRKERELWI